jgi:Protein of unknown function (DUF2971)
VDKNWKEKYWKYMAANNIEAAIPLKDINFPNSFFRYRSLTKQNLESLSENYLWLAEISTLNDPFECSIQFDNDECLRLYYGSEKFKASHTAITGHKLSKQDIRLLTTSKTPHEEFIKICKQNDIPYNLTSEKQLEKVQNRWTEMMSETNKNLRICSFSLVNHSLLLWSHYSNEHKGICIEYDFLEEDLIRPFTQPIIYRDRVHKLGIFEEYTIMQTIASSLIKSSDWSYEQEWRLTIFKQKENFPRKIPAPKPKAIYLGTRFDLNDIDLKNELIKYANENKIPLVRMKKHPNEFKLIEDK